MEIIPHVDCLSFKKKCDVIKKFTTEMSYMLFCSKYDDNISVLFVSYIKL